jgi:hypothetical protein
MAAGHGFRPGLNCSSLPPRDAGREGEVEMLRMTRWVPLLALGLAGCAGLGGEEPLYVLRDSLGRSVALAGSSQLDNAAPGSMVRANIGGQEQELMVGERVGRGPVLAPRPADPVPVAEPPPLPGAAAPESITSTPLEAPPPGEVAATPAAGRRQAVSETGANRSGRRRGPTSRAVSRSVM